MKRFFALCFATYSIIALSPYAHAQYAFLHGVENTVQIFMSPQYPEPDSVVHLSLNSPMIDLAKSNITWQVNSSTEQSGIGMTNLTIQSGKLGQSTAVTVSVDSPDGVHAQSKINITPTRITLIYGSSSAIPPFYRGLATASAGSSVQVEAFAEIPDATGKLTRANNISYLWSVNDREITNKSGRGKNSITIPISPLGDTLNIGVVARSSSGIEASSKIQIVPVAPRIIFYKNNPLNGIEFHNSIPTSIRLPLGDAPLHAFTYFSPSPANSIKYTWEVSGKLLGTSGDDVTLHSKIPANVSVNVDAEIPGNLFDSINGAVKIIFGGIQTQSRASSQSLQSIFLSPKP